MYVQYSKFWPRCWRDQISFCPKTRCIYVFCILIFFLSLVFFLNYVITVFMFLRFCVFAFKWFYFFIVSRASCTLPVLLEFWYHLFGAITSFILSDSCRLGTLLLRFFFITSTLNPTPIPIYWILCYFQITDKSKNVDDQHIELFWIWQVSIALFMSLILYCRRVFFVCANYTKTRKRKKDKKKKRQK